MAWHLMRLSQGDLSFVYITGFPVQWQMGIRAGRNTQDGSIAAVPVCLSTITVCVPRRGGQSASRSPTNLPSHYQRSSCWNTMLTSHAKGYSVKRRTGKRREWLGGQWGVGKLGETCDYEQPSCLTPHFYLTSSSILGVLLLGLIILCRK